MSEEKIKILEMLEQGKITVEESLRLLEKVENINKAEERYSNYESNYKNNNFKARNKHDEEKYKHDKEKYKNYESNYKKDAEQFEKDKEDFSFDINFDGILNTASNIIDSVANTINDTISFSYGNRTKINFNQSIQGNINSLELTGKNSSVIVEGCDENEIRLEVKYDPKSTFSGIIFEEKNGNYILDYKIEEVKSLQVYAKVPKILIENLKIETSNSSIKIENIKFTNAKIETKNSSIKLDNLTGEQLKVETRNGKINLEDSNIKNIYGKTSNGSINLECINCLVANLESINGSINVEESDTKELNMKTSNASINVSDIIQTLQNERSNSNENVYEINAKTSNATIRIETEDIKNLKIKAFTSHGKIRHSLENFNYFMNTITPINSRLDGETIGYKDNLNKMELNLSNSMGSINL